MSDSNITKCALAAALKELMQEIPFSKICVADICRKCDMHRKSFYYHFQDKYDLVNWIFDKDFSGLSSSESEDDLIDDMIAFCRILYEDRSFYCNALSVQGQNSLVEHIRELVMPLIRIKLQEALPPDEDASFYYEFFLDALFISISRWLMNENCELPEKFIPRFLSQIISISKYILEKYPALSEAEKSVGL